ncbi:hypothetical protein [Labedaea rhizosphaerae]|uniref:Zn-dependent protease with chaperone function n=1 Tax=Labedaea rhizosphaerae TaxID=598644 RepID=A0A4R6SCS3_LABRH|nr:hypothetical protein [Labedaea rhizosphaerae]TDP97464.1 hypothetical protein EV186_103428 [Labedaea rhizosphaerae]
MARVLVAGFYVVAIALVAALVWIAIAGSTAWTILCAVLAAVVAALVWSVSRFRPVVPAGPSFPVDPAAQPDFWAAVRSAAGEVGSRAPDEITLVSVADLALIEDAKFLGLVRGRRSLLIGIPLLAGLSVGQLRATLIQEFARDSFAWRAQQQVDRAVASSGKILLIGPLFRAFAGLFRAVAGKSVRAQLARADAEAVRRTGRSTVVEALRMRAAIASAWPQFAAEHLSDGQAPPNLAKVFHEFIADRDPVPDPARVAEVAKLPDTPAEPDGRAALDLFEGDALA